MRSTAEVLGLLVLLVLLGCGQPGDLPPAGAEGGELRIWRPAATAPTRIRAEEVRQRGPDPRRLDLRAVRAAIPLADGRCFLAAPAGRYAAVDGQFLELEGPVALHGWGAGGPFTGHAASARLEGAARDLVLEEVDLLHAGQHQRIARLVLPGAWGERRMAGSGSGLRSGPMGAVATAALAALPQSR